MLTRTTDITGYTLQALDGEIGRCQDFLFDDDSHVIRYMAAKTAKWLPGRKVVISPSFLETPDYRTGQFPVALTRKQIEDSPPLDEHAPVSRQYEMQFHQYYAMPFYWAGPDPWSVPPNGGGGVEPVPDSVAEQDQVQQPEEGHLRSSSELIGYRVEAQDGEIGHVQDFLVDDDAWIIRYLVVDTGHWLPGRKVLVSMQWLELVSWADRRVQVGLTRAAIETAPEYDSELPFRREDEIELHRHYRRPFYGDD